jgi:folylpolyglutamate synthase/dihydropteroate synthase
MAEQVIVTEPDSDRAMKISEVSRVMGLRMDDVIVSDSVEVAIETALENMKGSAVLVTGSFRMAEGAMRWLKKRYVRY